MRAVVATKGNCMTPYIGDGEHFLVEMNATPKHLGELVLVEVNGEKKLHRWMGKGRTKGDRMKCFDFCEGDMKVLGVATHRWVQEKEIKISPTLQKVQFALSFFNRAKNPLNKISVLLLVVIGCFFRSWELRSK